MMSSEAAYQMQRLQQYEEEQSAVSDFFFSKWFPVLSDLDGCDLLDKLHE